MTQQLIDEMRLSPENEMLKDVKKLLAEAGDVAWQGCYGESLVSLSLFISVSSSALQMASCSCNVIVSFNEVSVVYMLGLDSTTSA